MAAKQAEPENQAELVPGSDPDKIKNFNFFFQIIKSTTLLVQHVKGQPDSSRFVLEEGGVTFDTNRGTPCRNRPTQNRSNVGAVQSKNDQSIQFQCR